MPTSSSSQTCTTLPNASSLTGASKRRVCAPPSDALLLDCQALQRSLKRVRLSCSPGELRLQRDIRHLVLSEHWIRLSDSAWQSPCQKVRLERHTDPLMLILKVQHVMVWIQIPRMYPHRPPCVTRIQSQSSTTALTNIHTIRICEAHEAQPPAGPLTAVYPDWSPVDRLHNVIHFIVRVLNDPSTKQQTTAFVAQVPPTHSEPLFMEEHKMEDADYRTNLDSTFPPNRFDLGYYRSGKRRERSYSMEL